MCPFPGVFCLTFRVNFVLLTKNFRQNFKDESNCSVSKGLVVVRSGNRSVLTFRNLLSPIL